MQQQVSVLYLRISCFIAWSSCSLQLTVIFDIWLFASTTHSILYLFNINTIILMPFRSPSLFWSYGKFSVRWSLILKQPTWPITTSAARAGSPKSAWSMELISVSSFLRKHGIICRCLLFRQCKTPVPKLNSTVRSCLCYLQLAKCIFGWTVFQQELGCKWKITSCIQ